ncbi:MAG TPA: proline dehydrogenase family protein [Candidatus Eremiobacteraceae bacterium]|nr:proline dehydrogenase family protein [Candidatus Eremiobacteraceae bacterium]
MANIADFLNARPQLQRRLFFLAKRFVPGETIESAIAAVRRLNDDKLTATLDFLGEDVFNEADAAHTTDTYVEMIEAIGHAGVDSNVSVKLSAIGQAISEDMATANLKRIVERARPSGMFVRLDMEGSKTVDSTYRIMERVRPEYEHIGPVVQAYLRRAASDVDRHIAAGTRVRLCKGAYGEPPGEAIQEMPLIRRNYAQLAEKLLAHGNYPGIATHDDYLIDAVRAFVEHENVPADRFEYQMLYGIRPEKQKAIVANGYRMRVYVPFGTHWAGYFYRRLAERKENVYFVVRSLFSR